MRLTCPSCGAQYDVPAEAIPQAGRDVQCSACGNTWFQAAETQEDASLDEWDGVPRVADDEEEADDLLEAQAAPLPPMAPRSTVTPEVAEILRAEAAREAEARAQEAGQAVAVLGPRSRPEPGSRPPPRPESELPPLERALRRRAAPASPTPVGPQDPAPVPVTAIPSPEREPESAPAPPGEAAPLAPPPEPRSLPPVRSVRQSDGVPLDPEAIDATLRPSARSTADRYPPVRRRRSRTRFWMGLGAGLLTVALLAALYALAPRVTAAVPASAGVVTPYAEAVDRARDWFDASLGRVTEPE